MKAIISFSGFTQNRDRHSGTEDLWLQVLRPLSRIDLIVYHPEVWSANPRSILGQLRRAHVTEIMVIGYSWGAGVGAVRIAQQALQYGIKIRFMCLCDPVFRSRLLPDWLPLNPLSMMGRPKIRIPAGVGEVWWVRQKRNRPKGHDLVKRGPRTRIYDPLWLDVRHEHIDRHNDWITMVQRIANEFAR